MTDTASLSATATDTVKIDTVKPTVTLPADIAVDATNPSGVAVSYTATFGDATSGLATSGCDPASGSTFPAGTTTVTCTATDKAGNSQSRTFTVAVTGPPIAGTNANEVKRAVLASLQAQLAMTSNDTKHNLSDAIGHIQDSLANDLWVTSGPHADGNHLDHVNGGKVFDAEKAAVSALMGISKPSSEVKAAIEALDAADQLLAQTAIDDAIAAHADPARVSAAQKEMASAQADLAKHRDHLAIDRWKAAWSKVTATVPKSSATPAPAPATMSYSEHSSAIAYSGSWGDASNSGYIGGSVAWSKTPGSTATFTFTGSSVSWIGPEGPTRGLALVLLDGQAVARVDLWRSSFVARAVLFKRSFDTVGQHTLTIKVLSMPSRPYVAIDGFVVAP